MRLPLCLCLLLAASVSAAQPMPPSSRPQAATPSLPDELRQQLALTPAQVNSIVRLREQYRLETAELRVRLAALRAEQAGAALLRKPGQRDQLFAHPDLDGVVQRIQAAGDRHRATVNGLLDPSQRASLARLEQASALQRVIEQAQCFALLTTTPPDEPAACGPYQREP